VADINGVTLQAGTAPTVIYTITYTKSRPNNNQMTYNFTISAALGSSGSFIHNGYALLCTMTGAYKDGGRRQLGRNYTKA